MQAVTELLVKPSLHTHWADTSMRDWLLSQELQVVAVPTQEEQGRMQLIGELMQVAVPFSMKPDPQGHFMF
jgi:hypothetical protein